MPQHRKVHHIMVDRNISRNIALEYYITKDHDAFPTSPHVVSASNYAPHCMIVGIDSRNSKSNRHILASSLNPKPIFGLRNFRPSDHLELAKRLATPLLFPEALAVELRV